MSMKFINKSVLVNLVFGIGINELMRFFEC